MTLIVGAGMAGLLAGNMLLKHKPQIIEQQEKIPNGHTAVLRFRSTVVGDVLGIPFRRVNMIKTSIPWQNPVADALAYSHKNSGAYSSDRSIGVSALISEERFIAPPDLVARMAEPFKSGSSNPIQFNSIFTTATPLRDHGLVISTMPMPSLMKALEYPLRDSVTFTASPGVNIRATVPDCDAYVSLMVPNPSLPFSRISITSDELIIECVNVTVKEFQLEGIVNVACGYLGINRSQETAVRASAKMFPSRYAKINPINEQLRRDFMFWATDHCGIFSLGRFATWRPALLLDDLIKDIRRIESWSTDRYGARNAR